MRVPLPRRVTLPQSRPGTPELQPQSSGATEPLRGALRSSPFWVTVDHLLAIGTFPLSRYFSSPGCPLTLSMPWCLLFKSSSGIQWDEPGTEGLVLWDPFVRSPEPSGP